MISNDFTCSPSSFVAPEALDDPVADDAEAPSDPEALPITDDASGTHPGA